MPTAAYWESVTPAHPSAAAGSETAGSETVSSGTAEGSLRCRLCPHTCLLAPGATGFCRVRRNDRGKLVLPFYGRLSALSLDPIEKKPLHHFLPGSGVYSAGFFGCNLRCPFCQNWEISQETDASAPLVPPEALVRAALDSGAPSLAFTYSEPLVHFEYLLEAAAAARNAGLFTVLVTNGNVNEAPARELLPLIDAANVDIKCRSAAAYARELGGDLDATLRFTALAAELSRVEATTLVVPGLSDAEADITWIAGFLAGLDPEIPLHLSANHPAYHSRLPATEGGLLEALGAAARGRLRHVYLGNLAGAPADTRCVACGSLLVRRRGYQVAATGLRTPNQAERAADAALGTDREAGSGRLVRGRCSSCGARSPIALSGLPPRA